MAEMADENNPAECSLRSRPDHVVQQVVHKEWLD